MNLNIKNRQRSQIYTLPQLSGGISTASDKGSDNKKELLKAVNLIYEDSTLKSRQGLYSNESSILDNSNFAPYLSADFEFTDTQYVISDTAYKIAVSKILCDEDHLILNFFGINTNGEGKKLGYISFNRLDSTTFYKPKSYTLFTAGDESGYAIYALITAENLHNPTDTDYRIYKSGDTFGEWSMCDSEYIPTAYINGRGTDYELAKEANAANTTAPREIEAPNLLNGRFYAYYSSEGYSSAFRLPYSSIGNSSVICRIYTTPEKYTEWTVFENKNDANADLDGKAVKMTVNRERGVIYFTSEDKPFPIPKMSLYTENNIRILAKLDSFARFEQIVSCKSCTNLGEITLFSGGQGKAELYYVRNNNPLYFRKFSHGTIGDLNDEVLVLCSTGDIAFAFKKNSVYSIAVDSGKIVNKTSLLSDNNSSFFEEVSIKIKRISNSIGCDAPSSISFFKKSPIWYCQGKVYTLNSTKTTVIFLTDYIDSIFENITNEQLCGEVVSNKYILFAGNKALVLKFDITESVLDSNKVTLWPWRFDDDITISGIKCINRQEVLLCRDNTNSLGFTAAFGGNTDIIPTKKSGSVYSVGIEVFLKTMYYNFKDITSRYLIENCNLSLLSEGNFDLKFITDIECKKEHLNFIYSKSENFKPIQMHLNLLPVKRFAVEISADGRFGLKDAEVVFTKLS